jgi:hypothetical protein
MADLGRCSGCGIGGTGIMLDSEPLCDRCADYRLSVITGWPTLPDPPAPEVIIGPDDRKHLIRYRLLRMPTAVLALAEELRQGLDRQTLDILVSFAQQELGEIGWSAGHHFGLHRREHLLIGDRFGVDGDIRMLLVEFVEHLERRCAAHTGARQVVAFKGVRDLLVGC